MIQVGTANEFTYGDKGNNRRLSSNDINSLSWMPVAAAAASYYAIVGTEKTMAKAKQFVEPSSNTSYPLSSLLEDDEQSTKQEKKIKESQQDLLLQRAWGMISLPAVKRLSLEVSKLLKGKNRTKIMYNDFLIKGSYVLFFCLTQLHYIMISSSKVLLLRNEYLLQMFHALLFVLEKIFHAHV